MKLADRERLIDEHEEDLEELENDIEERREELDRRETQLEERENEVEMLEERVGGVSATQVTPQVAGVLVAGVGVLGILVSASGFTWSMLKGGAVGLTPINLLLVSILLFGVSVAQTVGGKFAYNRRKWRVALGASFVTLIVFPPAGIVAAVILTLSESEFR